MEMPPMPFVPLVGCQTRPIRQPDGSVHFVIGPLALVLPYDAMAARKVAEDIRKAASEVVVPGMSV
jgi:hypothetical protein